MHMVMEKWSANEKNTKTRRILIFFVEINPSILNRIVKFGIRVTTLK